MYVTDWGPNKVFPGDNHRHDLRSAKLAPVLAPENSVKPRIYRKILTKMDDSVHQKLHSDCGENTAKFTRLLEGMKYADSKGFAEKISYMKMKMAEIQILIGYLESALEKKYPKMASDVLIDLLAEIEFLSEDLPELKTSALSLEEYIENTA